jgi:pimeloyl-ACP methyl ester carboxylesterase
MARRTHVHPADLHGALRLAADATATVTDIVEAMHATLAFPSVLTSPKPSAGTRGLPSIAYSAVRTVAKLAGHGLDAAMPSLGKYLGEAESTPERDAYVSVLNGVVGDHLAATGNPLAIPMQLRRGGKALTLRRDALGASLPSITPRIAVLIHGLCGVDAQWKRADIDYTRLLASEFGYTPLLARYNSGLHVSENGDALAAVLEDLVREWPMPVDDLLLVGHSMGGLVARSTVHAAERNGQAWTKSVHRMAFLGTPHHGAPLERGGHWFEKILGSAPFAGPLARLGRLRSAGVTDLRHGNVTHEAGHGHDRFAHAADTRRPLPLPAGIDCLAVAATTGARRGDARCRLVGDGLVPVASALGHHADPARELALPDSQRVVIPRAGHMALLGHPEVWDVMSKWLSR